MSETKVEAGESVSFGEMRVTVAAKCHDSTAPGTWLCLTHEASFPNAFVLEGHVGKRGAHHLAWLCQLHGIEVP